MTRLVHLLGNETAYRVAVLERLQKNVVAPFVELLDLLALHVGRAGVAELTAERRYRQLARDSLADKLEALHDQSEVGNRKRGRLLGHDMTRKSNWSRAHLTRGLPPPIAIVISIATTVIATRISERSPGASIGRDHQRSLERAPRPGRIYRRVHRRLGPRVEDRLHESPRFLDGIAAHEQRLVSEDDVVEQSLVCFRRRGHVMKIDFHLLKSSLRAG